MPREKEGKQKTKETPLPIVPILQKFLKTYQKRCAQTQTSVCPAIKQDLKTSINNEQILRKVSVWPPLLTLLWKELTKVYSLGTWVLRTLQPKLVVSSPLLPAWMKSKACLRYPGYVQYFCLPPPTSKSTHPSPAAGLPFLIPLYIWNSQPAPPTLHLESPAQKHHFCHHCPSP